MRNRYFIIGGPALLLATPARASDFSGLAWVFLGGMAILLALIVGIGLALRRLDPRWLRNLIRAAMISAVIAPVVQVGEGPFGSYSEIDPMIFMLFESPMGDPVGWYVPPAVFLLVTWRLLTVLSRWRAASAPKD